MRKRRIVCLKLLAIFAASGFAGSGLGQSAKSVFERVAPSVVVVRRTDGSVQGSGVVIAQDTSQLSTVAIIVTNCHVVGESKTLEIFREGRRAPAFVLRRNDKRDICTLSAQADLPMVTMRPAKSLKVGERVFAIGAPHGLELSISDGIVAQLRNTKDEDAPTIQTNASISPGSSGGGLFDGQGKLVGITSTFVKAGQNLNFAVPSEWLQDSVGTRQATNVHDQLKGFRSLQPGDLIDRTCGWQLVDETATTQFYLDPCEVNKHEKYVLAWRLQSPRSDYIGAEKEITSAKLRMAYDCDLLRHAVTAIVEYSGRMGEGSISGSLKSFAPTEWQFQDVIPGSANSRTLVWACDLSRSNERARQTHN